MTKPYSVTAEQIAQEIDTDLVRGLTSDEASLRYAKNGPNSLGEELSPRGHLERQAEFHASTQDEA